MRHMTGDTVPIRQDGVTGRCRYGRLQVCGSVWRCPVCSKRITEQRRKELVQAVANAKAMGLHVHMLTQTYSHRECDDINDMLDKQRQAQRYFVGGAAASRLRKSVGLVGSIRAMEVTYGRNGYHSHLHTLWFSTGPCGPGRDGMPMPVNTLRLKRLTWVQWHLAGKKVGLHISYKHGLHISASESDVSAYLTKWGIETEMTKANFKTGVKADHVTPWGMLEHIAANGPHTRLYTAKFIEYAHAFQGERQLYWSKGLRTLLGLDVEKSDEALAEEGVAETPADIELAALTIDQWVPITRYNLEAQLLTLAERDPDAIMQFVQAAKHRYLQGKADREAAATGTTAPVVPMPSLGTRTPRVIERPVLGAPMDFSCDEVPPCRTGTGAPGTDREGDAGAFRPGDPVCDDPPGADGCAPGGVAFRAAPPVQVHGPQAPYVP